MAGGQIALLAGVLASAFAGGMVVQYVRDSLHCEHCHHIESERP